eukprot:2838620-Rhodomonas_salina.1
MGVNVGRQHGAKLRGTRLHPRDPAPFSPPSSLSFSSHLTWAVRIELLQHTSMLPSLRQIQEAALIPPHWQAPLLSPNPSNLNVTSSESDHDLP